MVPATYADERTLELRLKIRNAELQDRWPTDYNLIELTEDEMDALHHGRKRNFKHTSEDSRWMGRISR